MFTAQRYHKIHAEDRGLSYVVRYQRKHLFKYNLTIYKLAGGLNNHLLVVNRNETKYSPLHLLAGEESAR